jgi:type IV pilus assembly protein PilB
MDKKKPTSKPIGQRLLEAGLINELQLDLGLREQKRQGKMLGEVLVDLGFVNPEVLTGTLAAENKTEVVDALSITIDPEVLSLISYEDSKKYKVIPLDLSDQILTVAFADAFNVVAIDVIERQTKKTVRVVTAPESNILEAIEHNYAHGQSISQTVDLLLEHGITASDEELENISPMVRLVDQIIGYGIKRNAADIHIEPDEKVIRVRFRVDGVLKTELLIPSALRPALTARLKLIAGMNISEKRAPQDGRIHFKHGSKEIDLRISTLPTSHGESVVMRILDSGNVKLSIDWLGFSPNDKTSFINLMKQPYGMVLITGPTGSGKTTTLYTALGLIDKESRSVFTLEDPIEYSLPMIRQTPIKPDVGMDFAAGLKALLRQDPDVILIGEIRDLETAQLAIRAALTGHLVLTTLHTNTAAGVIPRLIDMGIEKYLLPPALSAAIGQRLVRKLCPDCKQVCDSTRQLLEEYKLEDSFPATTKLYEAKGCDKCSQTGFKGRLAIYEVMPINEEMHQPIIRGDTADEMESIARKNGMTTMLEDGLSKAAQGLTTVEEVLRLVR